MEWNDSAIVLHVGRFREADLWLKLLFRTHGVVTAFAFGGSRSRRRFCGCLDVLNTIACRVKRGRKGQYLTLEEGVLERGPRSLRGQWAHFGMLMNCVRFLDVLPMPHEGEAHGTAERSAPSNAAFTLMQDMLSLMEQGSLLQASHSPHSSHFSPAHIFHDRSSCSHVGQGGILPHPLHPILFRFRMACELGFAPAWQACSVCGRALAPVSNSFENILLHMDEGTCSCSYCAPRTPNAYAFKAKASAVHFLQTVESLPPTMWDIHALSAQDRQSCFQAVDGFTQFHLGIAWDAGRFKRV